MKQIFQIHAVGPWKTQFAFGPYLWTFIFTEQVNFLMLYPCPCWNSLDVVFEVGQMNGLKLDPLHPLTTGSRTLFWGGSPLLTVANIFSQLAYGNLYSFFCLFFFFITAVVNLDNSVVDLETLQALYENVSNRRTFKCEYIIHTQYRIYLGSLF